MKYFPLESLLEKTRKELLTKQKSETPARVKRAAAYTISNVTIDAEAFLNNWLVIKCNINGNSSSYTDVIAFEGVFTDLIEVIKELSSHVVNSKSIIKSIHASLDKNDIYLSCDCADFKYRYDYWSTQGKFKWGKLQNSNGDKIRNPHNDMGSMCKHLYALLRSNKFLNYISDKIMRTIMANLDILVKRYDINLDEFVINTAAYDRLLRMNIDRNKQGRFTKKDSENKENNTEENNNEDKKDNT